MRHFTFVLLIAPAFLISCAGTSSNIQTAPLQYSQDRATKGEDIPAIRGQQTVVIRNKPADGAVKAVADVLPNIASSLNPAGALTIFGTSPERAFSELETGKRKQLTNSFEIDQVAGNSYDIVSAFKGVRLDPDTGQLVVEDSKLNIKKTKEGNE